ncbi:MAG TPA: hypothetical protein VK760_12650 [Candidatus Acidoferrales bacterium]|nr:hypothetical protein [Candidatus Acidoferrales bacterium]
MKWRFLAIGLALTLLLPVRAAVAEPAQTIYTVPQDIHWLPDPDKAGSSGAYYAYVRGKAGDACDWATMEKFPDGFVYPMHVNHAYLLFTVIKGTLVIGFDKDRASAGERALPAGSFMQGLAAEPHYGRAIGETIFEIYAPCPKK